VLALDPQNVDASLALASLYARDGKPRLAVDVLTRLTKKSPRNDQAWLLLARLQAELHDDRAMKAAIDKALAINPDSVGAYALLFDRAVARLERRGLAHTLIGVTGDFVPPRAVLNPVFLSQVVF
jgi:predicted Zn-dependent protease